MLRAASVCVQWPAISSGPPDLSWPPCRRYSGTHRYTAAILAYVFGVGSFMAVASPNFGGLFKRQQALEGKYRTLQVRLDVGL